MNRRVHPAFTFTVNARLNAPLVAGAVSAMALVLCPRPGPFGSDEGARAAHRSQEHHRVMEEVAVAAAEWNGRFEFAETRRLVVELLEREPLIATALPTECGVRIRFAGDEHPEGIGLHGLTIEGIARVRAWRARARDPRVDRTR